MSDLINEDGQPRVKTPPPSGNGDETPPIDPEALSDYAEFQAFKASQKERAVLAAEPVMPKAVELVLEGVTSRYEMVDLDKEVISHLTVLTTFAENDAERAIALFEAMLQPDDFDRLKRDVRPAMREARRAHLADPTQPGVSEFWQSMATSVMDPLKELMADPKRVDSLTGQSRTGPGSKPGSPRSALPSIS